MTDRPNNIEENPEFVSDFWGRAKRGEADEVDNTLFKFIVTHGDIEKYPELKPGMRVIVAKSPYDEEVKCKILQPLPAN